MENTEKKVDQELENKKINEKKIVNLCEDMNPHEHDEKSYEKMISEQKANN